MTQIPTITLNDGNAIPQLGFGVWQVSTDDIVGSVATALETGYRHIDTAAIYGNEEGVGRAIADSGIARDELFVTTKLWNRRHREARAAFEESLAKLGLDHVDLYLIHWPSPNHGDYLTAWREMEKIAADGLARSIGVSNFLPPHLNDLLENTDVVPAVNQIELHPTFTQSEVVAATLPHGIAIEAYSPLGLSQDLQNATVKQIADRVGRTPAQVILRWHLQKNNIVFPKSVTPERIRENFALFDFELTEQDLAAIDGLESGNRTGLNPNEFG